MAVRAQEPGCQDIVSSLRGMNRNFLIGLLEKLPFMERAYPAITILGDTLDRTIGRAKVQCLSSDPRRGRTRKMSHTAILKYLDLPRVRFDHCDGKAFVTRGTFVVEIELDEEIYLVRAVEKLAKWRERRNH